MCNWKQDLTLAAVLLAMACGFFLGGLDYPKAAFLFPSKLAPLLGFLAILLGASALRRWEAGASLVEWQRYKAPALMVAMVAAYIGLLPVIGFIPASFLLAFFFFKAMNFANTKLALAVALGATLAIYGVFHILLEVSLPVGLFLED